MKPKHNVFISHRSNHERDMIYLQSACNYVGISSYSFLQDELRSCVKSRDIYIPKYIKGSDFIVLLWGCESDSVWIKFEIGIAQCQSKYIIPVWLLAIRML